jgi:hypothetical protein
VVAFPAQIVVVAVETVGGEGDGLMVIEKLAVAGAHPPLAAMLFVTRYVPALLALKLISPVLGLMNTRPGVELNIPALAPAGKIGNTLLLPKQNKLVW